MGLFTKKEIKNSVWIKSEEDYIKYIDELEKKVNSHKEEIQDIKDRTDKELDNRDLDHEILMKRKTQEVDVIVAEKTAILTTKVADLTLQNGNYKKEVEILTKAFENLGFDVKDMKSILDKLVDGIVGKNKIQVIK